MAGYKYYLGSNNLGLPERSYLEFVEGRNNLAESHHGIIIIKADQADSLGNIIDGDATTLLANDADDMCCDKIHIVYDDFNQNDATQPYKRYKITYYAKPRGNTENPYYGIYRTKETWIEDGIIETPYWSSTCDECYHEELLRDHLDDMEFVAFNNMEKIFLLQPKMVFQDLIKQVKLNFTI